MKIKEQAETGRRLYLKQQGDVDAVWADFENVDSRKCRISSLYWAIVRSDREESCFSNMNDNFIQPCVTVFVISKHLLFNLW